jgi:PPM family protein phosphatase
MQHDPVPAIANEPTDAPPATANRASALAGAIPDPAAGEGRAGEPEHDPATDHAPATDDTLATEAAVPDLVAEAFSHELLLRCDDDVPRRRIFARGTVWAYSRRSPGRTTPNEDAAAILRTGSESGVLVVADGVGGERAGDRAAALAVESLRTAITEHRGPSEDLRPAILDGIERANREILALGLGAATTLAVAEVHGREMRSYHVGDSMILLVGQRGRVKVRAMPHSPVGHAIEAGLLDASAAMNHAERHLVSNLVGTPDMRIEIGSRRTMAARDTLVLSSDGLSDNLTEEEIVDQLRCGPLHSRLERLVARTHERMTLAESGDLPSKPDDLTVLVYRATSRGRSG